MLRVEATLKAHFCGLWTECCSGCEYARNGALVKPWQDGWEPFRVPEGTVLDLLLRPISTGGWRLRYRAADGVIRRARLPDASRSAAHARLVEEVATAEAIDALLSSTATNLGLDAT